MSLSFTVLGVPAPQGSFRAVISKDRKRAVMLQMCKRTMPWRQEVAGAAMAAILDRRRESGGEHYPVSDAVELHVTFFMPRPKSHFGKKGLRGVAPRFPAGRPDLDKLLRAFEDALIGIVYDDDSRVVVHRVEKVYASGAISPRAVATVVKLRNRVSTETEVMP